jgi:hypothetical protein
MTLLMSFKRYKQQRHCAQQPEHIETKRLLLKRAAQHNRVVDQSGANLSSVKNATVPTWDGRKTQALRHILAVPVNAPRHSAKDGKIADSITGL